MAGFRIRSGLRDSRKDGDNLGLTWREHITCNQSKPMYSCVTEKYSKLRPSEVDYILIKKIKIIKIIKIIIL